MIPFLSSFTSLKERERSFKWHCLRAPVDFMVHFTSLSYPSLKDLTQLLAPRLHPKQRNCLLENVRQEINAKIGVKATVLRQLSIPVLLFSRRWKIVVNFAFLMAPKSAVKSSRRNRTIILYYYKFSDPNAHWSTYLSIL